MSRLRLCGRQTVLLVGIVAGNLAWFETAHAASITWDRKGPFETCLESKLEAWLAKQAELQISEDPAASRLDDAAVAAWTVETLQQCRAGSQAASPASEDQFTKHMAQWRRHIYDLAADILKKGRSD